MGSLSGVRSLWIHQYDQLGEASIPAICATATGYAGATVVLKKLFDGSDLMGPAIDHDPLAPVKLADFQAEQRLAAGSGVTLLPWINPTHAGEAAVHAQAGPVLVLDLEPYAQFWQDAGVAVLGYLQALRAAGVREIIASIDPRPQAVTAIDLAAWVGAVDAIAPQLYWIDFQESALAVGALLGDLLVFGRELVPVLPWDGAAADVQAAWACAEELGCTGCSLWRMGVANLDQLKAFGALPVGVAPVDDVGELKRQLGVAEGKLQAIGKVLTS